VVFCVTVDGTASVIFYSESNLVCASNIRRALCAHTEQGIMFTHDLTAHTSGKDCMVLYLCLRGVLYNFQ
jgi:hypothetical protein